MPSCLETLARGVFLPVTTRLVPEDHLLAFLDQGGRAILFGEDAAEYRSGRLSATRLAEETAERAAATLAGLRARSGGLLAACDADLAAVNRLQGLAGALPTPADAARMSDQALFEIMHDHACRAKSLGFTLFLSPTADLIRDAGWLAGRTLGAEAQAMRLIRLHVRAIRQAGISAALKHFPGHPRLVGDPGAGPAHVPSDRAEILSHIGGFRAGIAAGAEAVVLASAHFDAFGAPASLAPEVIHLLRRDLGFTGLVITLDLDHPACQGDLRIEEVCLKALQAGADLLLLSPGASLQIPAIARHLAKAVDQGHLSLDRLRSAAAAVHRHAL